MRIISTIKQIMKINSLFVHFRPVAIKQNKTIKMIKTMGPKIRKNRSFFLIVYHLPIDDSRES